jgi:hypothetical protein
VSVSYLISIDYLTCLVKLVSIWRGMKNANPEELALSLTSDPSSQRTWVGSSDQTSLDRVPYVPKNNVWIVKLILQRA